MRLIHTEPERRSTPFGDMNMPEPEKEKEKKNIGINKHSIRRVITVNDDKGGKK